MQMGATGSGDGGGGGTFRVTGFVIVRPRRVSSFDFLSGRTGGALDGGREACRETLGSVFKSVNVRSADDREAGRFWGREGGGREGGPLSRGRRVNRVVDGGKEEIRGRKFDASCVVPWNSTEARLGFRAFESRGRRQCVRGELATTERSAMNRTLVKQAPSCTGCGL